MARVSLDSSEESSSLSKEEEREEMKGLGTISFDEEEVDGIEKIPLSREFVLKSESRAIADLENSFALRSEKLISMA